MSRPSRIENSRETVASRFSMPGPEKNRRRALPMVPSAGRLNWLASKTAAPPRGLVLRSSELPLHSGVSTPLLLMPLGIVPSSEVSLLLSERDRQARGEARDPGHCPAIRHCVEQAVVALKLRNLVVEGRHKVVPHVEGRKSAAQRRIDRIDRLRQSRRLIDRLRNRCSWPADPTRARDGSAWPRERCSLRWQSSAAVPRCRTPARMLSARPAR